MPAKSDTATTSYLAMFKQAFADWSEDKATKLAAALAFYTMLSIGPLLIFSIKIISVVFKDKSNDMITGYLDSVVGAKAAEAAADMIKSQPPSAGWLATTIGVVVLLFSASGVFGELQDSLNTIWEVKPKPNQGMWATVRQRFFSFTLVLGVAFLLLVSLVASAVLAGVSGRLGGGESMIWKFVNLAISLVVVTGLFAAMFRYLPDVRIRWRNVIVGAALTAVLFTIGKALLGWYLGRGSTTSVYGAAGSLVALLLWVYYAAQIYFFGAEFTQVYAKAHGDAMEPSANAVRITEEDRAQQGIPSPERVAAKVAEAQSPAGTRPARLSAMPPRVVNVPVPTVYGDDRKRQLVLAGAGLVVGAVAGALGATNLKKDPTRVTRKHAAAVNLDERIHAIESKLGRASRMTQYLNDLRVSDRIDEVEKRIRHAGTAAHAQRSGRPRWAVRLGELIAGD